MKFGCFGSLSQLPLIQEAGFDSAELNFCELTSLSDSDFESFRQSASKSGLGLEVFSGLIPLTERFHSPDFRLDDWLEHTRKGAARAAQLGTYMIPFGAGKCRSIPADCTNQNAAKQKVLTIVRSLSDVLSEFKITLVVEPLGPANSNYLNTIPETVEFIHAVNRKNCSCMCDLRHMHKLHESMNDIVACRDFILHAHIDYPRGDSRYFPSGSDSFDYAPYFAALARADYHGLLTVEATAVRTNYLPEAKESVRLLHELAKLYDL